MKLRGLGGWYGWYVVWVLFFVNIMNYGQRMSLSVLLPSIKRDIALTDTELGMVMGGAFALLYATAGIPLAQFATRRSRRNILALALMFWSMMTVALGLAQNYAHMLLARVGLGVAQSVSSPCSHSIILEHVSEGRRSTALGLHATGVSAGIMVIGMAAGWLESHVGWRMALVLIGLPGVAMAILVRFGLPDSRPAPVVGDDQPVMPSLIDTVRHLARSRFYLFVLTGVCIAMLVEYGTSQWLPSYYVRQFEVPVSEVAFKYSLMFALGGIPGCAMGGIVADRLIRRDRRWMVWMPAATYMLAVPVGLCVLTVDSFGLALGLNALYVFLIQSTSGAMFAACYAAVLPQMRATTTAITYLVGGLTGIALGPILVGVISDLLGAHVGDSSLQYSLVVIEAMAIGVVVFLALAARHFVRAPTDEAPGADLLGVKG